MVRSAWVLYDAPHSAGMQGVLEFPECVAFKVEA
jgi:hypothetical protein